ncbi:general odorant-binding protein 19d-like [Chironomus tepperi]|uniref:general odorant-binding protein 19d-like n=1 Tax=Chironomus tepperi TaxID=113505 RepID=UPI00391F0497
MKYFSTLLVASLAICVHAGIDKDKAKEMAVMLLNHCKTQEGGTDADVEIMMNLKYPESANGLCMIACIHEKMGFFTDGVFSRDIFVAITQQIVDNDPAYMQAAEDIATKCGSIGGSRCEQAIAFDKCMEAEMKSRDLFPQMV